MIPELPKVLVAIIAYNALSSLGPRLFSKCLKSIMNTEYPSDRVKFVVVDNSSLDKTTEFIEANFTKFEVLRLEKNKGYGGACNYIANLYRDDDYEYLAFLNDDLIVDRRWLIEIMRIMHNNQHIGAASPRIYNMNSRRWNFGGYISLLPIGVAMDLSRYSNRDFVYAPGFHGAAFVIRKDVFFKAGGFDEGYFMYDEDRDLSLRIWLTGYAIVHVKNSIVYHIGGLTAGKALRKLRAETMALRNSIWTSFKDLTIDLAILECMFRFFFSIARLHTVLGFIEALISLKKVLRNRRYGYRSKRIKLVYKIFRNDAIFLKKIIYEKVFRQSPGF